MMNLTKLSRYLSYILRHHPEAVGISLDEHGWANVEALIEGISEKKKGFDREILEEIVRTDEKQRYSFSEDGTRIRANQGHSVLVDVNLEQKDPPEYLWHGTAEKSVSSIQKKGLLPMSRLYVHLSKNAKEAEKVGARHGKPVVYRIKSGKMAEDGYCFYQSANKVWQTKMVPIEYLENNED